MLTGIKTCVVEAERKAPKEISHSDFSYCEKLRIDSSGKILGENEKCDFEFKDYAPTVFKKIREISNIKCSDYIKSISDKFMLLELSSPGKSGSFFYFSPDYRYLIKTVHYNEHRHFFKVLDKYYKYLEANPNTLIMSIYGLYRLKADGHKMYFIVMQNVYPPNKDMHRMYDLKGSTFGRFVPLPEEEKNYARTIFKDKNWTDEDRHLILGPEKRKLLLEQLEKDSNFLQTMGVMDYSLLLGIHQRNKGNSENIRMKLLSTFAAVLATVKTKSNINRKSSVFERRMTYLPDDDEEVEEDNNNNNSKYDYSVFNKDDGGFISTDENNNIQNEAYYMGIIDYLAPWDFKKIVEHYFKTLILFQKNISAVSPKKYGKRFFKFVEDKIVLKDQPSTSTPQAAAAEILAAQPSTSNQTTTSNQPSSSNQPPIELDNLESQNKPTVSSNLSVPDETTIPSQPVVPIEAEESDEPVESVTIIPTEPIEDKVELQTSEVIEPLKSKIESSEPAIPSISISQIDNNQSTKPAIEQNVSTQPSNQ